jgi:hypothetical protein
MGDNWPSQFSPCELTPLLRARVIYLATVRKNGTQSSSVPLWFTVTTERRILIQSGPDSWHTRRVRRGSPVILWFGGRRSRAFLGKAELSNDPMVIEQIIRDYPKKYLMARLGLHRPTQSGFERGERLAIKITPVQALPLDFRSRPGALAPRLADVSPNGG